MENRCTKSIFEQFYAINIGQLSRIVHKLKNKSGTDEGIIAEIMKKVTVASTKIYFLLSRLLEEGVFPTDWKEALVISTKNKTRK